MRPARSSAMISLVLDRDMGNDPERPDILMDFPAGPAHDDADRHRSAENTGTGQQTSTMKPAAEPGTSGPVFRAGRLVLVKEALIK